MGIRSEGKVEQARQFALVCAREEALHFGEQVEEQEQEEPEMEGGEGEEDSEQSEETEDSDED